MKKTTIIRNTSLVLLGIALSFSGMAQIFPVDTLVKNGNLENRINMVYLSDGYQSTELGQFIIDANSANGDLFGTTPFVEYQNFFNAFAISVPSTESGADHPQTALDETFSQPLLFVDTYFESSFDIGGIHRLVVPTQSGNVFSVLQDNFPLYDEGIILVNSPYYGGSGGTFATSTTHPSASEITIHELGHSFGNLGDEYNGTRTFCGERPNVTGETDPNLIKWKHWIEPGTPIPTTYDAMDPERIGLFEGAGISNFDCYRPRHNCKMRSLGVTFCQVCIEHMILVIHNATNTIDSHFPEDEHVVAGTNTTINFNVDLIQPDPNTLRTEWWVNGVLSAVNTETFDFTTGNAVCGYQVEVRVYDTTAMSRLPMPPDVFVWEIGQTSGEVASPDTFVCAGQSVQLNATGGVSYSWSPASYLSCTTCPDPIATPPFSITYTVAVVDGNGCLIEDEVLVDVGGPSAFAFASPGSVYIGYGPGECSNLGISAFGGQFPYTYSWSTGETTRNIEVCPTVTTTYTGTVTDALGCSASRNVTVTVQDVRCGNDDNNGNNEPKIRICHIPQGNPQGCDTTCVGYSSVESHFAHGDVLGDCDKIFCGRIIIFEELEFSPEEHAEDAVHDQVLQTVQKAMVTAIPNPFREDVTLQVDLEEEAFTSILITDLTGRRVAMMEPGMLPKGQHSFQWNGQDRSGQQLASGLYLCHVTIGQQTKNLRLVLIK